MKREISKKLVAGVFGASLAFGSMTAWGAPVWSLPERGLQLEEAAKQAYVAAVMEELKNPTGKAEPYEVPDGWSYEKYELEGVKVEKLVNPQLSGSRVILELHGGGYVLGHSDAHRRLTEKQGILSGAREMYMVDYRLAPRHTYPAALEDAVKVYKELLARGKDPGQIIVTGDSAGGNLALALCLYLKEHGLPQPALLILVSPWTTAETRLPSRSYNADRDLILGKNNPYMYDAVKNPAYAKGYKAKDARLSPLHADLSGLPPMLIQVGSYELFFDEDVDLAKKAAADGVDVTVTSYPGMSHDFALLLPELQESVDSFEEIRDFVSRHMD